MNSYILLAAASCYLSDFSASASIDDDEDEDEDLGGDDGDSGEPEDPAPPKSTKAKKKVKKVKKAAKKGGKASKKTKEKKSDASDKNRVRLKDLAKQAKITEAVARKKLRDAGVPRGEGRWSWELGSKALKQARKALDLA